MPMDFISKDLIGPFEITLRGNQYTLIVICMLANYITCVPLVDRLADIVVRAYLKEMYCRFFPNSQSQESGSFSLFERDAYIPTLANLLQPKLR